MKRFNSFAAFTMMLVACTFILTACGGDDDDDKAGSAIDANDR